ncbi:hypothetical protein E2P81_ATG05926 [Venturia nashicola]|nr:hypothetical protein E2P81_ATG05926 [Venturia nashicola]
MSWLSFRKHHSFFFRRNTGVSESTTGTRRHEPGRQIQVQHCSTEHLQLTERASLLGLPLEVRALIYDKTFRQ